MARHVDETGNVPWSGEIQIKLLYIIMYVQYSIFYAVTYTDGTDISEIKNGNDNNDDDVNQWLEIMFKK